ncbi:MAG: histidine phosphatase family protein [Myxococcota bacterium]|nr:histidine phosphatase family protein [Myxococcota bacterium]
MSTLFFVRHGQASFGKETYDRLSEKGILQSQMLADYFHQIGITFDVCYTGTLKRQITTGEQYLNSCESRNMRIPKVVRHEGLNENNSRDILISLVPSLVEDGSVTEADVAGLFQDKKSFQLVFEKAMLRWVSGHYDIPQLARWTDFTAAVNGVVDEIMDTYGRGKRVVAFTSGGPLSVVVQRALNLSGEDTMQVAWQIANTSVTRFKCTEKKIMLASFNELAHLELKGDDSLITYR